VDGSTPLITPATVLNDEPTTFQLAIGRTNGKLQAGIFREVTLRKALMYSLNVATVRLAEMAGYEKVRNLALAAGFNRGLLATPAIALGAYVATPLEVAGAIPLSRMAEPTWSHGISWRSTTLPAICFGKVPWYPARCSIHGLPT